MTINLKAPELRELKPRIMVCGVGGAGGNAVNNMIVSGLLGVDFIVANTDAQALTSSKAERIIQMGLQVTEGLGAGSQPEVGRAAAEEAIEEIRDHLAGAHMVFVTAGMGGGTGTGAAPVIARTARDMGILTVGVVTKPFQFEGARRMRIAETGITELQKSVDTLIVIPNQNLFRVANEKTTFADAFAMADQVLYSGVACITDLMVKEGLINLDFADVRAVMREMGKAMMGTGEASGDRRAMQAAEAAIANPLLDEVSMKGARGLLISITGGNDLTLYEVDEAASRIRQEVDEDANIILGATYDQSLDGIIRVSVVATGIDTPPGMIRDLNLNATEARIADVAQRLRAQTAPRTQEQQAPAPVAAQVAQALSPASVETLAPVYQPAYAPSQTMPALHDHEEAFALQAAAYHAAQDEVMLQPIQPKTAVYPDQHFDAPMQAPVERHVQHASAFIPPSPEMPMRPVRLPTIEELPLPAQTQLRAHRGDAPFDNSSEVKRRTLLEKLASFGLSRHEETAQAPQPAPAQHRQDYAPRSLAAPQAAAPTRIAQNPPAQGHVEYGRRPAAGPARAQGNLDPHGRVPSAPRMEEDQLEIPAFLRRQSS